MICQAEDLGARGGEQVASKSDTLEKAECRLRYRVCMDNGHRLSIDINLIITPKIA